MRVRTIRQAKAIGTTGKAIVKSSAADIRQMGCPRCGQTAVPCRRPDGQPAFRCQACGTEFKCTSMDRPRA